MGNIATKSIYEDEGVRKIMENNSEFGKRFREVEFGGKLDKAVSTRMKGFEDMIIEKDDRIFYQTHNEKHGLDLRKY